ncbi:Hypothetical protein HDN1F_32530 [gamma proteobacterium HdN1]|nr:Hypothetical protein HDN1F_32530 [gamma proteobacterium HdN1]
MINLAALFLPAGTAIVAPTATKRLLRSFAASLFVSLSLASQPASATQPVTPQPATPQPATPQSTGVQITQLKAPLPFEAQYKANYNGYEFGNLVTRRLERLPNGEFRHSYRADYLLYFLQEESVLQIDGCNLRPLRYELERGTFLKKKRTAISFDWKKRIASYEYKGKSGTFPLVANAIDPMNAMLRVACQLTTEKKTLSFPQVDDNKIETQDYRLLGPETLDTANGKINTIRVERVHDNNRQTLLWLMASNPTIVVRGYQRDKDGSIYKLELLRWKLLAP